METLVPSLAGLLAGFFTMLSAYLTERSRRIAAEERIDALEDRLQSSSLSEYRTVRPVAMPAHLPEPEDDWLPDATGTGLYNEQDE